MILTKPAKYPLLRALSNVIIALIGAYGLSVTGFLVLRLLVGDQWTIIEFFNSFIHLLLAPSIVLIPVCLLLRRFRLIIVLIPPLVAFLLSYSVFFTPHSVSIAPDVPQIHILTYNLKSQTENLDSAIAVIRDANADVVLLQELSEEASAILAETFGEEYPNQALHPQSGEPIPGQGVLSRLPITSDEYWRIHFGQQRVALTMSEHDITLYNVHAVFPFAPNGFVYRHEEITDILERAGRETNATIIAGDFNMTDQAADYWRILSSYADAQREIGWGMGFTFPDYRTVNPAIGFIPPLARIDYVFHSDDFQAVEARVWPSSGDSDHRPLYATLALVNNK